MNKTLALLLVATLVGIYAVTEIQELGNANADAVKSSDVATSDDAEDDDLGEDVGRRGGAFLSTTGSFTLSSGSNTAGNDEEDDELGEDDGVGRRPRLQSRAGSAPSPRMRTPTRRLQDFAAYL